jgi:LAO/AO transport system kinase
VISLPEIGDDIQALKAGKLEIGDVFIVNKADRPAAGAAITQLSGMPQIRGHAEPGCAAAGPQGGRGGRQGVVEIVDACLAHRRYLAKSGRLVQRMSERDLHLLKELVKEMVWEKLFAAFRDSRRNAGANRGSQRSQGRSAHGRRASAGKDASMRAASRFTLDNQWSKAYVTHN